MVCLPMKHFIKVGIRPPRIIVVIQTIISTVLFTIDTRFLLSGVYSIERMRAKATDPLIVPAAQITDSSLTVTFHFMQILKRVESPKIAKNLARKQTTISNPIKLIEKTS